jgi:DeoR family glycerol-3-phosphate regulon repressor
VTSTETSPGSTADNGKLSRSDERQALIAELVHQSGAVSVSELSDRFGVTYQTIRRDLRALEDKGIVQKGFGGAFAAPGVSVQNYSERLATHREQKRQLVLALEPFLTESTTLFVGLGTTFAAFHEIAARLRGALIATPNLEVAYSCSQRTDATVFVYGGYIKNKDSAIMTVADDNRMRFKFDVAVIGASAIDEDGTLLDFDPLEVDLVRSILPLSRRVIAVVHEEKFNGKAPHRITELSKVDVLITNANPAVSLRDPELIRSIKVVRSSGA